jgi:hypothetical protein
MPTPSALTAQLSRDQDDPPATKPSPAAGLSTLPHADHRQAADNEAENMLVVARYVLDPMFLFSRLPSSMMYAFGYDPRPKTTPGPKLSLTRSEMDAISPFVPQCPRDRLSSMLRSARYTGLLRIINERIIAFGERHGKWHVFDRHFAPDEIALFEALAADRATCQAESDLAYEAQVRSGQGSEGGEMDQADVAGEEIKDEGFLEEADVVEEEARD